MILFTGVYNPPALTISNVQVMRFGSKTRGLLRLYLYRVWGGVRKTGDFCCPLLLHHQSLLPCFDVSVLEQRTETAAINKALFTTQDTNYRLLQSHLSWAEKDMLHNRGVNGGKKRTSLVTWIGERDGNGKSIKKKEKSAKYVRLYNIRLFFLNQDCKPH